VHVLTPFVERLATEEEKKAGLVPPDVLNRTPAELQGHTGRSDEVPKCSLPGDGRDQPNAVLVAAAPPE